MELLLFIGLGALLVTALRKGKADKEIEQRDEVLNIDPKRNTPLLNAVKSRDFWKSVAVTVLVTSILWLLIISSN